MKPRLLAALLSVAAAARANPFELYGFTPRATGMGGAMTAVGEDLGASFYNPAALLGHTRTELGLGFADTISSLWIHRARDGTAASQVERAPRFEGGVIFPLGGNLLKDRVVIGIGGGHPIGSLVRVQTVDEAHPQFYMYQSKAQRFALDAAVGVRIVEGLSLGVGVQVIAEQIGRVNFALDLASRQFRARDITGARRRSCITRSRPASTWATWGRSGSTSMASPSTGRTSSASACRSRSSASSSRCRPTIFSGRTPPTTRSTSK